MVADAFAHIQEAQGDHLTGPEVSLGVFRDGVHRLIDLVKQRGDKTQGGHELRRSQQGFMLLTSVEHVHGRLIKVKKYY
jgi:hypothetical protein